jgi:hypothetical protein
MLDKSNFAKYLERARDVMEDRRLACQGKQPSRLFDSQRPVRRTGVTPVFPASARRFSDL